MNVLVSASIGLYVDRNEQYYLQIITADKDSEWILSISKDNATSIAVTEDLEVSQLPK